MIGFKIMLLSVRYERTGPTYSKLKEESKDWRIKGREASLVPVLIFNLHSVEQEAKPAIKSRTKINLNQKYPNIQIQSTL